MNYVLFFFGLYLITACKVPVENTNAVNIGVFIEQTHQKLIKYKNDESIDGLAFAIFRKDSTIYQQCIGNSTYGNEINDQTLFSIQSVSKNITALSVMLAVQNRLLDLDTPISEYLPNFTVNSCFEDHPERKITLRMLLSHTAGFTHEAPRGNNYDYTHCSFDEHIESISKTWLKFPVGLNYSYSNLGFDLAAKIVENVTGVKFNDYLKSVIFDPAGMEFTTIDDKVFIENDNKTEGTIPSVKSKHYTIPLIGSGAIYSNLSDMIKYVQLQMRFGKTKEELIERSRLFEMYKIRFNNYGLGTYIDYSDSILYLNHNGSGYGYSATILWFPEYNTGSVLLCNKQTNTFSICEEIMKDYIAKYKPLKDNEINNDLIALNKNYFDNKTQINEHESYYCSTDTLFKESWEKYTGTYSMTFKGMDFQWYAKLVFSFGFKPQKVEIRKAKNVLRIKSSIGKSVLREYKPGMFFTNGGEVVDFSCPAPTYKNIELKK